MKLGFKESSEALEVRISAHKKYSPVKIEDHLEGMLKGKTDVRILDVGCGSGNFSDLFSRHAASYSGMDVNRDLLNAAQKKCADLGLKNTNFVLQDMDVPFPFADDSFDFVFFVYSAYYTKDIPALIGQAKRVLATGGKLCFIGPVEGNGVEIDAICQKLFNVTSSKEKDARVGRLEREFLPELKKQFPKNDLKQIDFSLTFPSVEEYARYFLATPQYVELAKTHRDLVAAEVNDAIKSLGHLRLTKKALFLWGERA